jgi:hypothetical protein
MIEVLKQTMEALERSVATCFDQYAHQQVMSQPDHFINQAITSLRQAIAQLERQEPVAWADMGTRDVDNDAGLSWTTGHFHTTPLYTHPPQRTEQEQPLPPVEIGVDVTADGASVVAFYSQFHPPPQRTWVGLTDEEIEQGYETTGHYQTLRPQDRFAVYALSRAIEAKLKEKNT